MKHQIVATPEEILEKIRPVFEYIGKMYKWDLNRNAVDGSYLNHSVDRTWTQFENVFRD